MPQKKQQKPDREQGEELSGGTRDRILEAALAVFAEKGLHGATVVEIAKRAGMTGGALYRYYPSKEDIFQAVVEKHSVAFTALDMIRDLMPELKPASALKFIAQGMFLYFGSNVDFMRVVVSESLKDRDLARSFFEKMLGPAREFIFGCIETWRGQGLLREDVDSAMATDAYLGMMGYLLVERAFLGPAEVDLSDSGELAERLTDLFLRGVLT